MPRPAPVTMTVLITALLTSANQSMKSLALSGSSPRRCRLGPRSTSVRPSVHRARQPQGAHPKVKEDAGLTIAPYRALAARDRGPPPLTVPRSSVRTQWVDASSRYSPRPRNSERELFRAHAASASTEVRTRPAATRSGRASSGPSTARPGSRRATSPGCRRRGLVSSHRPPPPPLPPIRAGPDQPKCAMVPLIPPWPPVKCMPSVGPMNAQRIPGP